MCNIVGPNHHRERLGVEPPGPLPILQPPQQVHSLVARDACNKRPVETKRTGSAPVEQWLLAARLPWVSLPTMPPQPSICRGLKRQPEEKKRPEAGRRQRDSVPRSPLEAGCRSSPPISTVPCSHSTPLIHQVASLGRRQPAPGRHVAAVPVAGIPAHALASERLHDAVAVQHVIQALE